MSRPLRLEFPGSLWHVTVRGNERRDIFLDDTDRNRFLDLLGESVDRFKWIVPTYALMPNHVHSVIQLSTETLSRGMCWLNGNYAREFNRRHRRVGHLFQGRFKPFLIDKDAYFLEVLRYVVLNPVRAFMVAKPEDYDWTSYRAIMVAAWVGCYEALLPNRVVAAGLRLRSSSRVSALIRRCDRELVQNVDLQADVDRCIATLRRKQPTADLAPS